MKRTEIGIPRKLLFLYRVLILTVACLVLVLIGGTVYGIRRRYTDSGSGTFPMHQPSGVPEGESFFTGIGRIRAESAGSPSATVILSIVFPYSPSDRAFSEELAGSLRKFREIASDLISSLTADQLESLGEGGMKNELLDRYNALLRLGTIDVLYFSDYLILE